MVKNVIKQYDPATAMIEKLNTLEQKIRDFKNGVQSPSIKTTGLGTITTTLYSSWAAASANPPAINLQAVLLPSVSYQKMFAVPEFYFVAHAPGTPTGVFPEGSYFLNSASPLNTPSYLDVSWWLDSSESGSTGNLSAHVMLRLDAAMWGLYGAASPPWDALSVDVGVRWRYMLNRKG